MDTVKEKPKEKEVMPKMKPGVSRVVVEVALPKIDGLKRKIHWLHDHNYRVNFWNLTAERIVKSHYVIVHEDKTTTIRND